MPTFYDPNTGRRIRANSHYPRADDAVQHREPTADAQVQGWVSGQFPSAQDATQPSQLDDTEI